MLRDRKFLRSARPLFRALDPTLESPNLMASAYAAGSHFQWYFHPTTRKRSMGTTSADRIPGTTSAYTPAPAIAMAIPPATLSTRRISWRARSRCQS